MDKLTDKQKISASRLGYTCNNWNKECKSITKNIIS